MDFEYWLKFYYSWEVKRLVDEIGSCHRYQQKLMERVAMQTLTLEHALRLMVTSQLRETVILQVIRERREILET